MKIFKQNQSGDTIIEVIISITIISTALTLAFSLGTTAQRTSEQVNYRTEALALANSQVELLKNVVGTGSDLTPYKTTTKYCITFDQAQHLSDWTSYCQAFDGNHNSANSTSIFSVTDIYKVVDTSTGAKAFDINVQWPDNKALGGFANMDVYYQP